MIGDELWKLFVADFSEDWTGWLSDWRGYSREFCEYLRAAEYVGVYDGNIAFPVHDEGKKVVRVHFCLPDGGWRYHPSVGTRTTPLVLGNPETAHRLLIFESQWDAFAFID